MMLKETVQKELERTNGVLFGQTMLVGRGSYKGRNILTPNSRLEDRDDRGYYQVERWIMSVIQTQNPVKINGEGMTRIKNVNCTLRQIADSCPELVFGTYLKAWPLIKVLDIGGEEVETSFGTVEAPPIPPHIHAGCTKGGKGNLKCGKAEAQYFPPTGSRTQDKGCVTRMGFKPGVTRDQIAAAIAKFGKSDEIYDLMKSYTVYENETWMVRPGFVHAPGPKVTIEVQLAQDDFNFLGYQLGQRLDDDEVERTVQELHLRGLKDTNDFLAQCVDWNMNIDPDAGKTWLRKKTKVFDDGTVAKYEIFFDYFEGEEWVINRRLAYDFINGDKPSGCLVWSGRGEINGTSISAMDEFLIVPDAVVNITAFEQLIIYVFYPIPVIHTDADTCS